MSDELCNEIEIQGYDVLLECIRPASHPADYHMTNIGQRWAVKTRILTDAEMRMVYELFHHGKCPTPDCLGDENYAAPGRGHIKGCTYPIGDLSE